MLFRRLRISSQGELWQIQLVLTHTIKSLWAQILTNFVIPQAPKLPPKERKLAVIGLVRMLTESSIMSQEPSVQAW